MKKSNQKEKNYVLFARGISYLAPIKNYTKIKYNLAHMDYTKIFVYSFIGA